MLKLHLHLPNTPQTYEILANLKIDEDAKGDKIVHLTLSDEDADGLVELVMRHLPRIVRNATGTRGF